MKRKKISVITMLTLTMLLSLIVTSCGNSKKKAVELTDKSLEGEMLIDFSKGADAGVLFESDGWSNGSVFNVVWTKDNVKYEEGIMKLGITKEDKTAWVDNKEVTYHYTAGEARTQNYYGHGDYEVKMKPSANPGTASTFFVCTGPYDEKNVVDKDGNVTKTPNPHDEIDIEFLGKDTTKVQFNFFVDGKGGNEYMYDLGFDASKEYHEYGFRWTGNSITWFVDNKPVYKVTTDKTEEEAANLKIVEKLPSTPGRLLANYWCGNKDAEGWMGKYSGNNKDEGCEYLWIQSSVKGEPLNPEVKPDDGNNNNNNNNDNTGNNTDKPVVDWNTIEAIKPTFNSTDKYTVTNTNTSSNITYTAIGGSSYLNVEMDIKDAAKAKNALHLSLKNNASTEVLVRVNVIDAQLLSSGAQNASTNQSATMDGVEVKTDLEWGGSFFTIPAGKTVEAVVYFNGSVETLQLMVDSSRNDAATYAGDITVDAIKFGGNKTATEESDDNKQDENKNPDVSVDTKPQKNYTFTTINKNMKIKSAVTVRDLPEKDGEKIGALGAGKEVYVFGKCNETGWYKISYKNGIGYVSVGYVDETSGTTPSNPPVEPTPTPSTPSQPEAPKSGDLTTSINGTVVTFGGNVEDGYIVNANDANNTLNVSYSNMVGNCYKNIWADVSSIAGSKNKFNATITNNGNQEVKVRIDMESATQINANTTACNLSSSQDGVDTQTDLEWGGSMFTVPANSTVTVEVVYDVSKTPTLLKIFVDSHTYNDEAAHTGNITFSEMTFGTYTPPAKQYDSLNLVWVNDPIIASSGAGSNVTSLNIKFNGTTPNWGAQIGATPVGSVADKTTFSVKITNNKNAAVRMRFDLKQGDAVIHNTASATGGAWTETQADGVIVDLGENQEVVLTITLQAGKTLEQMMIWPCTAGGAAGAWDVPVDVDVTISEFEFK